MAQRIRESRKNAAHISEQHNSFAMAYKNQAGIGLVCTYNLPFVLGCFFANSQIAAIIDIICWYDGVCQVHVIGYLVHDLCMTVFVLESYRFVEGHIHGSSDIIERENKRECGRKRKRQKKRKHWKWNILDGFISGYYAQQKYLKPNEAYAYVA